MKCFFPKRDTIRIKILTNWCEPEEIRSLFFNCTPNHTGWWKNLYITGGKDYDYVAVINNTTYPYDPKKAIHFFAEPMCNFGDISVGESSYEGWVGGYGAFYDEKSERYEWKSAPFSIPKETFFVYFTHKYHNFDKWFINLKYNYLMDHSNFQKNKILSSVISATVYHQGHKDRVAFASKYLSTIKSGIYDHYGKEWGNTLATLLPNHYRGCLREKSDALIRYRYHFNAENCREPGYFTEKIIDPILCESLCFYDGCPNITQFVDPESFVQLDLRRQEESFEIVKKSIMDNEWEKRLPAIREQKRKFMNEMNPLEIIRKIIYGEIK